MNRGLHMVALLLVLLAVVGQWVLPVAHAHEHARTVHLDSHASHPPTPADPVHDRCPTCQLLQVMLAGWVLVLAIALLGVLNRAWPLRVEPVFVRSIVSLIDRPARGPPVLA